MKTLVAGPWIGEFGWEIMEWQAHVRRISEEYDKVVCLGRQNSSFLYSDFCDIFIPLNLNEETITSDSWYALKNNGRSRINFDKSYVRKILHEKNIALSNNTDFFIPKKMNPVKTDGPPYRGSFCGYKDTFKFGGKLYKQKFIQFGKYNKNKKYDIIIHARNRKDVRPEDNWSIESWKKLIKYFMERNEGLRVASIGTRNSAIHIPNTDNFLNSDLSEVSDIIRSSKVFVGPLSGPTHLSALCGTPQVVWSEKEFNKLRCVEKWNPFGTKISFINKRNPDCSTVCKKLEKYIQ